MALAQGFSAPALQTLRPSHSLPWGMPRAPWDVWQHRWSLPSRGQKNVLPVVSTKMSADIAKTTPSGEPLLWMEEHRDIWTWVVRLLPLTGGPGLIFPGKCIITGALLAP